MNEEEKYGCAGAYQGEPEAWDSLVKGQKEMSAVREEDMGRSLPTPWLGSEQRCTRHPGHRRVCSCPGAEAAWLEGEITSSGISRASRKNSENYSPLISFHFIAVCLSLFYLFSSKVHSLFTLRYKPLNLGVSGAKSKLFANRY